MQRRRFIKIVATHAAGLSLWQLADGLTNSQRLHPVRWQGYTLGAVGNFTLFTDAPKTAQAVLQMCFKEMRRLESLFSIYDGESELSRLNVNGRLNSPSADWLPLLKAVERAHRITGGLFDPTVQPLWSVYSDHFRKFPNATTGPNSSTVQEALEKVGWCHLNYDSSSIQFDQPGSCLTLNGIAQGFITDRVTDILKEEGFQHALVELGETRAIGCHPEQRPWKIGIKDASKPGELVLTAEVDNTALATSGSYGSLFSNDGNYHHLIDPFSGLPKTHWQSLSVIAPTATEADALSTGLSFADETALQDFEQNHPSIRILKQP